MSLLQHSAFPSQRTRLAAVWGFEIRQPVTEVDNCNIADVLFISQIYNVKLELKHNSEQKVDAYFVKPKLQQT
jgi:hypothetical protein